MTTHARTLGLATLVTAALLTFAGSAAATQLTSPAGTAYTGSLHTESQDEAVLHFFGSTFQCDGTVAGNVEQHGSGITVKGSITALTFSNCSAPIVTKTLKGGTVEIHPIAGTHIGTVTSTGYEIELTAFGIRCLYTTNNTHLGTLTGSDATGGTAVFDVSATLPRTGGSAFCPGQGGLWTGNYKVLTPDSLLVDA